MAARERAVGDALAAPFQRLWGELGRAAPGAAAHPRATLAVTAAALGAGGWYYARRALVPRVSAVDTQPVSRHASSHCSIAGRVRRVTRSALYMMTVRVCRVGRAMLAVASASLGAGS